MVAAIGWRQEVICVMLGIQNWRHGLCNEIYTLLPPPPLRSPSPVEEKKEAGRGRRGGGKLDGEEGESIPEVIWVHSQQDIPSQWGTMWKECYLAYSGTNHILTKEFPFRQQINQMTHKEGTDGTAC